MSRTRPSRLLLWGAVATVVGLAVATVSASLAAVWPAVPWTTSALMAFLAILLAVARRAVLAWKESPGADLGMDALRAARMLVLGKAGGLFGALSAGLYAGFALAALTELSRPYGRDVVTRCIVAAGISSVVAVAGLALERACEVAPPDDGDLNPSATLA